MNEQEAAKLASRIKHEAWHQVKVKRGKTNGRFTFHIFDTQARDRRRASTTIYTVGEWLAHPLNLLNKPRAQREEGLDEYIDRFTKHSANLQVLMGSLNERAVELAAKVANFDLRKPTE